MVLGFKSGKTLQVENYEVLHGKMAQSYDVATGGLDLSSTNIQGFDVEHEMACSNYGKGTSEVFMDNFNGITTIAGPIIRIETDIKNLLLDYTLGFERGMSAVDYAPARTNGSLFSEIEGGTLKGNEIIGGTAVRLVDRINFATQLLEASKNDLPRACSRNTE